MKNIHLLPTDKPSRLVFEQRAFIRPLLLKSEPLSITKDSLGKLIHEPQNIYITSDEEIKVGDWFIHPDSSCFNKECKEVSIGGYEILQVIKVDENFIYHSAMMAIHKNLNIKKIILTTDQDLIENGVRAIDDEFLEWFVKNPTCEHIPIITTIVNNESDYKTNIGFESWRKEELSKRVKINFESINKKRYKIIPTEKVEESRERIRLNMKTFLKKINNKNSNNLNNGC